ncbi:MAG TPA: chemotaxis protein CheA [bacterium]|nr:chemotaxis protein CheA [bacterium]HRQ68708.1 chemotaxis protein CheA [bacterium]
MNKKNSLYTIFLEEAAELVSGLENDLLVLESNMSDRQLVDQIFRAVHTLKGSSGMVEYSLFTSLAHEFENILSRVRSGDLKITGNLITVFLNSTDVLKQLVSVDPKISERELGPEVRVAVENLKKFKGMQPEFDPVEQKTAGMAGENFSEKHIQITLKFKPDIFVSGTDPLMLLKELSQMGEFVRIKCNPGAVPVLDSFKYESLYLSWELILKTDFPVSSVENVFVFVKENNTIVVEDISSKFVEGVDLRYADKMLGEILEEEGYVTENDLKKIAETQKRVGEILVENKNVDTSVVNRLLKSQQKSRDFQVSQTIRVDAYKLDRLVNLVGELVIGIARVNQIVTENHYKNRELNDASEHLERISRYIQEQVMKTRMIPIEGTFRNFQRVVRDMAGELSKRIKLFLAGSETELDKTLIEQIDAPLKHLIRNSIDHGIGSPEERLSTGKPVEGSIWMRAYQQEGKIIIEVEDDGKGIDKKEVLKKATERGLYKGGDLSDKEIYNFLFTPGFSTAKSVTEFSGRGVGLDVVRKNIENLRGSVEVFSEKGKGTLFRIKLPLTLAIIEGMQVSIGKEVITVPLFSIIEAVRPESNIVKTIEGKGELIEFRGGFIPLIRLYEVFDFPTDVTDPLNGFILILDGHNRKIALMVDDIIGQQQVVIKSLEKNHRQIPGISGATVLGDGRISLILDVYGLEKLAFGEKEKK